MAEPTTAIVAGTIVSTAIQGISAYMQTKAASREARAQAQQLKNNMQRLQEEIQKGEVDLQSAMARIDTLINNTKGELKTAMESQVDLAVKDIKEQYSRSLREGLQNIKSGLAQRRLLGAEAGVAATRRTTKEVEGQAERNIADLRQRAINQLTTQIAQLNLKGGLLKEGQREAQKQFRLGTLSEVMQLGNLAGTLERQADTNPLLAGLVGAAPGLAKLTTQALTPGIETTEQIKPVSPSDQLAKAMTTPADIDV
jgi:hypothetical protein